MMAVYSDKFGLKIFIKIKNSKTNPEHSVAAKQIKRLGEVNTMDLKTVGLDQGSRQYAIALYYIRSLELV